MAVQAIQQPIRKAGGGGLGSLLGKVAGGIVGGIYGGYPGAMAGSSAGGMLGGAIGNVIKKPKEMDIPQAQVSDSSAMSRRQELMDHEAKIAQLKDSAMAASELPPDQRGQYLEPIMKAASILSQSKGQGQEIA